MALTSSFCPLPCFAGSIEIKTRLRVRAQSSASSGDSIALSSDSLVVKEVSFTKERVKNQASDDVEKKEQERYGTVIGGANERLKPRVERKWMKDVVVSKDLEFLWDDGYRTKTIIDYLDGAAEMIKPDGGPPRWFCPLECGEPFKGSPVLLFLPGFDGVGLGLILHHKAIGKVFDVRCLHIPVHDRTPFQATSFGRSQLQSIFPALEALPNELHMTVSHPLGPVLCRD